MVVGWLVGVVVAVGELLAVAEGLGVGLLLGVATGGLGVADGAAGADAVAVGEGPGAAGVPAGWMFDGATTATGVADEAPAASRIPATMATMPPMPPAVTSTRVQEEAGRVPGSVPLPVNGVPLGGREGHGRHPVRRPVLATASRAGYPAGHRQAQPKPGPAQHGFSRPVVLGSGGLWAWCAPGP